MNVWVRLALYFVGAVAISVVAAPLAIRLLKKLKARQTVLGYVTQHEHKTGTPTMGGIIFLLPIVVFSLIEMSAFSLMAMALTLGYAALGFLDDFIKIRFSRNLGLKAYQKIIGQLGLSGVAAYFCFASPQIGTVVNLPFAQPVDFGWGIIPFVMLVFVATTNSVNLTDGLDGLAGNTSLGFFAIFTVILCLTCADADAAGDAERARQLYSLAAFCIATLGGVAGYLVFNSNPAAVMMGDTGSLGLGAAAATVAVFSQNPFLILSAGIMFVWSSISVIVQVLSFKATGRRVFKMAPFHHHLEMSGWSEARISALYLVITLAAGAITVIFAGVI